MTMLRAALVAVLLVGQVQCRRNKTHPHKHVSKAPKDKKDTYSKRHELEPGLAGGLILFWHFHKAGGTSFCRLLKSAGYKEGGYNCGCSFPPQILVKGSWRPNPLRFDARYAAEAVARSMKKRHAGVCMVEHGDEFPTPEVLRNFSADWRALGGKLAAVVREPWGRFTSTYYRDYGDFLLKLDERNGTIEAKEMRARNWTQADVDAQARGVSLEAFADPKFNSTPMGRHARTWGSTNRANFYVRHLNGIDDGGAPLGETHLRAAVEALDDFTHVFLLDGDVQVQAQRNLTDTKLKIKQAQSNNPFHNRKHPENLRIPPPPDVDHYRATFAKENCLDLLFFAEVQRRIERDGTCRGCAPAPDPRDPPEAVCRAAAAATTKKEAP